MREAEENRNVAQDTEQSDPITRSVATLARRTRRALSPWVQRCLGAEDEASGPGRRGGARPVSSLLPLLIQRSERAGHYRRRRQTAFTAVHAPSLVGRAQRVVERGTVWRPDVGSLKPAMVARFASAIVGRFPPIGAKYQPRPSEAETAQEPELPLTGGPMMLDLGPSPLVERSARPTLSPTMLPPRRTAPTIQRTVTPPPAAKRVAPALAKKARLFSRVEELPAEEGIPTGDEAPGRQPAQVRPAQVEQDTATSESAEVKQRSGQPEVPA